MEEKRQSTYEKALEEENAYRASFPSIETWGEKLRLVPATPDLISLYYEGGDILFVNIHGGGFCFKHPLDNDAYCHYISATYCVSVLNVDYTTSAKWGFPVQLEEISQQVRAILSLHPKKKVIVVGHSSGANLAAALIIKSNRKGDIHFSSAILDYPMLDLSVAGKDRPEIEGLWPDHLIDDWADMYCPSHSDRKDPLISPLYLSKKEAKEFPPTYIVSATRDRLQSDATRFDLLLHSVRVQSRLFLANERHGFIERNMQNVYHLPNDPAVRYAKSVVDQEVVYILTLKN